MLKKSIFTALSNTVVSPAAPAVAPMRHLNAIEVAAVAGGPEVEHEPVIVPLVAVVPPPPSI